MRKSSLIHLTRDTEVGEPDATETGMSGSEGGSEKGCAQIPPVGDRQVKARSGTSPAPYPTSDRVEEKANPLTP